MRRPRLGTSATVCALAVGATSGHLLYPAWLAWRTRGGRGRVTEEAGLAAPGAPPALTVLVPAFREAGVIVDKIADLRANGYPGPLDVLVIADGDPETADAAERAGARVLACEDRLGKSGPSTGASRRPIPLSWSSATPTTACPRAHSLSWSGNSGSVVGAVAGEKLEDDGGGGESLYWEVRILAEAA